MMPIYSLFYRWFIFVLVFPFVFINFSDAQTYTFNPDKSGCTGIWQDGNCWDLDYTSCPSSNPGDYPGIPPTNSGTLCDSVNVIINNDLSYTPTGGNVTFGAKFNKLTVGNGAAFTVNGDVNIASGKKVTFRAIENSSFNIEGRLTIKSGTSSIRTSFNVDGDNTSFVQVNDISIEKDSNVEILEGGDLIVENETRYNGGNVTFNVYGFYRTSSLITGGNNGVDINALGFGRIIIENSVQLQGTINLTFSDDSEFDVNGDLVIGGNVTVKAKHRSKIYVCGEIKNKTVTVEEDENVQIYQGQEYCRVLPVNWLETEVEFDQKNRQIKISWATAKEWENSHFEVERSVNGIDHFETIGRVEGMGWTDLVTDYTFMDYSLPPMEIRLYYRIKQVDLNTAFEYSETLSVKIPAIAQKKEGWRVYPNPMTVNHQVIRLLRNETIREEPITIKVISPLYGQESVEVKFAPSSELNLKEILSPFPNGLLILEVVWGGNIERIKLLKQ